MPAQCMHAVDVRFTATPNWRERRARNGQNLTKSKKCTSDKKSPPGQSGKFRDDPGKPGTVGKYASIN